jgi:hypothetical protein
LAPGPFSRHITHVLYVGILRHPGSFLP